MLVNNDRNNNKVIIKNNNIYFPVSHFTLNKYFVCYYTFKETYMHTCFYIIVTAIDLNFYCLL